MRPHVNRGTCAFILLFLGMLLLSVSSHSIQSIQESQNYVLIFFSDMNLDPAPVLYTKGKDATITSTGHFRIDNLKNFTQMTVHSNFETSPNVYPTYIVIINLNGKTLVNHICSRPLKDYEITVGTDLLKKGINDVEIILMIRGITAWYTETYLALLTSNYLYISNEKYSPPFVVTTDISEYLTRLRIEQISMRQRIEDMNSTLTQMQTQLQKVQSQIKTQSGISGLTFLLLIINLSLLVYLTTKMRR